MDIIHLFGNMHSWIANESLFGKKECAVFYKISKQFYIYSHMFVTIERNTFQVWLVNYRLDFTASIKIFFSLESLFRIILCGFTQPLKLAFFLYGWQPSFLIHATKFFGDIMIGNIFTSSEISPKKEEWMNKNLLCSLPVHLDMTVLFGIAIFIVVCNAAR